ncbi:uncharacterized protein LOC143424276 [Xylocopa sonorina]|uniref:uncharacterized protein LOC143424276 n=1 Tax=Xylocopa sonorina TaxID=1818115 RepID=UPI00403B218F
MSFNTTYTIIFSTGSLRKISGDTDCQCPAGRGKTRGQGTTRMPVTIHLSTTTFFVFSVFFFVVLVYTAPRWHSIGIAIDCSRSRAYQNILDDPPFDSPFIADVAD